MNRVSQYRHQFLTVLVALLPTVALGFQTTHKEIDRTNEKELRATIDVSFGTVVLERGPGSKIAILDYEDDSEEENRFQVSYDVRGDEGVLKVRVKKRAHMWSDEGSDEDHTRKLTVQLGDKVPVSLEVVLGAGKGELDLSGLLVRDFKISTGASSVDLRCDKPNQIPAENVGIESGVSKFTATNLCNTNFQNLKFSGGVGSYRLDFGGDLHHDASAKIEVGLGSVTVIVPKQTPAKLLYDASFFSSFSLDDDFSKTRSGVYETDDFGDSENRLTIQIESGLGSVKVKRN